MTLEDLFAKLLPQKDAGVAPSSSQDLSTQGGVSGSDQMVGPMPPPGQVPQTQFRDNFSSPSPAPFPRFDPNQNREQGQPIFSQPTFPLNQPMGMSSQPSAGHFQTSPALSSGDSERLARIEEKLKILSDKIDLMAQQVSVVWELERRKMP